MQVSFKSTYVDPNPQFRQLSCPLFHITQHISPHISLCSFHLFAKAQQTAHTKCGGGYIKKKGKFISLLKKFCKTHNQTNPVAWPNPLQIHYVDRCLTDIVLNSRHKAGSGQTVARGSCIQRALCNSLQALFSFVSQRLKTKLVHISPSHNQVFILHVCTAAQRYLDFKIIGRMCQTQLVSVICSLQLCLSPEEEREVVRALLCKRLNRAERLTSMTNNFAFPMNDLMH